MTPQRWKRIEEIAEAALKRDALQRVDFLDKACEGESELRQQVDGFLAALDEVETFLERPANLDHEQQDSTIELAASSSAASETEGLPSVGSYRLLREIGQGGMGTVYLAARDDDEFEHRVAVKLLRPGANPDSLMRRFRSERQILANLDHPNIGKLLDGGSTAEGRPYLVMELITGQRIDEYCARYQLTIHQRLDLFLDVCAAVAYAHRNLVVHRDIKPTNILVTDDGTPKLLDFGIAKLLDPTDFPLTIEATETGLRPMTPPYASPEQIQGQPITTASDVYSLGVLLYKLLTGRLPFSTRDL
ncbi:MAG: serine/threonine-protein kinase, partial [Acidobacteriota bacterium]